MQDWAEGKVELRCNYYGSSAAPTNCYRAGPAFPSCPTLYSWTVTDAGGPHKGGRDLGQSRFLPSSTVPRKGPGCVISSLHTWQVGKEMGASSLKDSWYSLHTFLTTTS